MDPCPASGRWTPIFSWWASRLACGAPTAPGAPSRGIMPGNLLYSTLIDFGFATGRFEARPDDSLTLRDTRIVNAVRCVPPENKPVPVEIRTCRTFLSGSIQAMPRLKAVVTLGKIAHDSTVAALGARPAM